MALPTAIVPAETNLKVGKTPTPIGGETTYYSWASTPEHFDTWCMHCVCVSYCCSLQSLAALQPTNSVATLLLDAIDSCYTWSFTPEH
jgi:hypothetical protein